MPEEQEPEEAGEVRFKPSPEFWRYLGWLSRNTVLGRSENDVARQVLTERLSAMRREDYSDAQKP